jgi:hypothetical protein
MTKRIQIKPKTPLKQGLFNIAAKFEVERNIYLTELYHSLDGFATGTMIKDILRLMYD